MLDQRQGRWGDVVQMLYKCLQVLAGNGPRKALLVKKCGI